MWKTEQEAREQILWGLSQADIVKISDEETQFLWDCSPEEGAERVLALGAKLVMVTLGPKGCLLKNKQADFLLRLPEGAPH
ncbi:MAG: PfkB family carbohydrate kinase [Acutalibacteraceae bacterium]